MGGTLTALLADAVNPAPVRPSPARVIRAFARPVPKPDGSHQGHRGAWGCLLPPLHANGCARRSSPDEHWRKNYPRSSGVRHAETRYPGKTSHHLRHRVNDALPRVTPQLATEFCEQLGCLSEPRGVRDGRRHACKNAARIFRSNVPSRRRPGGLPPPTPGYPGGMPSNSAWKRSWLGW